MAYKNIEDRRAHDRERHRKYMNEWRAKKGESYRTKYRIGQLRRDYGLSESDFMALLKAQGCACAACHIPFSKSGAARLTVDHNHKTGVTRGLLCCSCNRTIGHARESLWRLSACITYLEDHN